MKRKMRFYAVVLVLACLVLGLLGCDFNTAQVIDVLRGKDITPPRLTGMKAAGPRLIRITFDEPVMLVRKEFSHSAEISQNQIIITLNQILEPGSKIEIGGTVRDAAGNRMSFSGEVYGYNPNVPRVIITELTTAGTEKSPDRTELLALSSGNMAGMCLCDGIRNDFDHRFIFPDCPVESGDYIIVCWDGKFDLQRNYFHAGEGTGLSSYNGVHTIYQSPAMDAACLDCLIYANHEGTAYSKFGTRKVYERAKAAAEKGLWVFGSGKDDISGDFAVNSNKTTATRSISRKFPYRDTNSNDDWYVTATGGSTFGSDNTSEPL